MTNEYTSYKDLLQYALAEADVFSIVWQHFKFDESAFEFERKLKPWLISEVSSSSWPGTITFAGKALIQKYEVNEKTIDILRSVKSVFDFSAPSYPEDLAFYNNGKVIFSSVAHEKIATYET